MKRVFVPVDLGVGKVLDGRVDRITAVLGDMGFTAVGYYLKVGNEQLALQNWRTGEPSGWTIPKAYEGSSDVRRFELDVPDDMPLSWIQALFRHAMQDAGLDVEVGQPLTRG